MFLKKLVNVILCKVFYRVKFEGRENIDLSKNYVFVANHVSAKDAMWIWSNLPNIGIMAKEEIFKFKPLGAVLKALGVFPIARGKKDFGHVYQAVKIIKSNKNLLIFPEGTRNARQKNIRAKNGATYIAATSGVQIIPIHITEKIRIFSKIRIVYGKPITLNITKEQIKDKQILKEKTDMLMKIIYSMGDENGR